MEDQQILLTPEAAALRLSLGRSAIFSLLASGESESMKVGRSRRIPVDALNRFVERRLQGADAPAVDGD